MLFPLSTQACHRFKLVRRGQHGGQERANVVTVHPLFKALSFSPAPLAPLDYWRRSSREREPAAFISRVEVEIAEGAGGEDKLLRGFSDDSKQGLGIRQALRKTSVLEPGSVLSKTSAFPTTSTFHERSFW